MQNKNPYVWHQKCLICVFLGWNLKMLLSYLKPTPRICLIAKFREKKQKCLNLPDMRILELQFENTIVIFEIYVLEFVLMQSLVKSVNLGLTMPNLDILVLKFENNVIIF